MAPRQRLARRRESLGYTQNSLAKHLRVQRSTVVRWETGTCTPQPWVRPRLARALEISPEMLDALLADADAVHADLALGSDLAGFARTGDRARADAFAGARPGSEIDDMNRRELLRLFSMTGVLLALPPTDVVDTERLTYAADRPGYIDDAVLDEYSKLNAHLWQVFALSAYKSETLSIVRRQLDVLIACLQQSHPPDAHGRLCAQTGDLFQLAGEIFFDGNHYTEAAHCYTIAASASKQANAFDLWACALTRHAFIALYECQFGNAATVLDVAAKLADRGDSALSTRYWIAAVEAETYAGLGNLPACRRALDRAEEVQGLTGQMQNGGWLRFDGSRLAEGRGTCYVALGSPDLAECALADALKQNLSTRRRVSVLTDLAIVGAQRSDPDQVLTFADAAFNTMRYTDSGVISRKLLGLRPHLTGLLGDGRVRRLDVQIADLARVHSSDSGE